MRGKILASYCTRSDVMHCEVGFLLLIAPTAVGNAGVGSLIQEISPVTELTRMRLRRLTKYMRRQPFKRGVPWNPL